MDDHLLIEYIKGTANKQTADAVESWVMQSEENMVHFTDVKDAYIYSTLPNVQASDKQMRLAKDIVHKGRYYKIRRMQHAALGVAAVLIALLVVNAAVMLEHHSEKSEDMSLPLQRISLAEYPHPYIHTIYTNRGTKGEVVLPDSSIVKLNSDTKIIFPDKFNGPTREVFISGEAYFKVKSNPDIPMVVTTNKDILIKVLGTEFNVRSYDNEAISRTTLYNGKVDILKKNASGITSKLAELKPSESYITRIEEAPMKVMKADTVKISAWSKGVLVFDNTPMEMVVKELERWYGASITVKDNDVYKYSFTAKFKQESLVQILESIKFCTNINYKVKDNNIELY